PGNAQAKGPRGADERWKVPPAPAGAGGRRRSRGRPHRRPRRNLSGQGTAGARRFRVDPIAGTARGGAGSSAQGALMSDTALKTTPLTADHVARGARMVPFAGYSMPVQYADGVLKEHLWTREHA